MDQEFKQSSGLGFQSLSWLAITVSMGAHRSQVSTGEASAFKLELPLVELNSSGLVEQELQFLLPVDK